MTLSVGNRLGRYEILGAEGMGEVYQASPSYGMDRGGDGSLGHRVVIGLDGSPRTLSGIDGCDVGPGDRFVLETPRGGGFGEPEP